MNYKNSIAIVLFLLGTTITQAQVEELENPRVREPTVIRAEIAEEYNDPIPFMVLEIAPQFKACKDIAKDQAKDCFYDQLNKHIKKNLKYPKEAKKNNIEGKVHVLFIINEEGKVTDLKTKAQKGTELLEVEAIRIIKKLPQFIPATQRGRKVKTSYAIPIEFKLTQ